MFGDLHIHMILDGVYYRAAIDAQKEHPLDGLVRARLSDYQARGVCLLRDGGDAWGVSLRARELAGEYGICPPGAAHKCTDRRDIPGSTAFVPPIVGLLMAGEVIKDLTASVRQEGTWN